MSEQQISIEQPERTITDIDGIWVGHWTDPKAKTGCTAVIFPHGAVGGVDVRGAAPGTRETDLLNGYHAVEKIHAIMLCGGSAFGLSAADGAMRYLEQKKIGFQTGETVVPIIPAAVLYDLGYGDAHVRPDAQAGEEACKNASAKVVEQGNVGAGCGATVGKVLGKDAAMKGGIGSACMLLPNGIKVAALIAVNAMGDIVDTRTGRQLAGPMWKGNMMSTHEILLNGAGRGETGTNTTIGVLATDAVLTREQTNRMATMGHDGLAKCIWPVHTPLDGDTLFGVSTGEKQRKEDDLLMIFTAATCVTEQAVIRAIAHANDVKMDGPCADANKFQKQ